MDSMAKLIGYHHIFSTVYHPQTNGIVEHREHNNWDEYLLPIIFAYNTGIHATTQYSPYQLQFGREPRLPTDEPSTSFIFNKPIGYYDQLKKSSLIIQRQAHGHIIYRQR
ncbi:unnamed protein product [Rotaria socialis]|uniref:Integrase catalytic domain-containing protein n=1 Tax=Rotaria socialis TaxID=392032 RepID=A0A817T3G7_9BILA|nr:unnamed protein product [Rotaria socialis]